MQKILLIPVLFAVACLMAGLYGALHDQISYTVSPDFFHQFKFIQFDISPDLHNRLGAARVGWMATWWMGIVIGLFIVPLGMIVPGAKRSFVATLKALGVVAATALGIGLAALIVAYFRVDADNVGEVTRYRQVIHDPVAFMRAGTMHNFSYLGGLIGILSGGAYLIGQRRRAPRDNPATPKDTP